MTNTLRCSALCYLKVVGRHRNKILLYLCFPSDFPSQPFHSISPYPLQWKSNLMLESTLLSQCWFLPVKQNEIEYSWHWNCGTDYAACSPCICCRLQACFLCALILLVAGGITRMRQWDSCPGVSVNLSERFFREWLSTPELVLCSIFFSWLHELWYKGSLPIMFLKYFRSFNWMPSQLLRRYSLAVKFSRSAILRPRPVILGSEEIWADFSEILQ